MLLDSSAIQIRRAVRTDASKIASVLYDSFLEFKQDYTPEAFAATILYTETIRDHLREGPTWVALQNESVVGTVSAISKKSALYIRSMAVTPEARGQGIGKLLLTQVEIFAREKGFHLLTLSTTPFLASAIRLYESLGFRRTNEGPQILKGTPLFSMTKSLKSV